MISEERQEEIANALGWASEAPDMIADSVQESGLGEPLAVVFVFEDATAQLNRHDITLEQRKNLLLKLRNQLHENAHTYEEHRLINSALS